MTAKTEKNVWVLKSPSNDYSLDFIKSDSLVEIEAGIRETLKGVQFAGLAMAVSVYKIRIMELYKQAGYDGYARYCADSESRLSMPKQTLSDYFKIGEVFIEYRADLEKHGFDPESGLHKLRFLPDVVKKVGKSKALKSINSASTKDFKNLARGTEGKPQEKKESAPNGKVWVEGSTILVNGEQVLTFSSTASRQEREFVQKILTEAYRVRWRGLKPVILGVQDSLEEKRVRKLHQQAQQAS